MKDKIILLPLILSLNIGLVYSQKIADSTKIVVLETELEKQKQTISELNIKIAVLQESISNQEKNGEAQREFYKDSQTTIIQIISAAFALLLAAFGAFVFLYNKPQQIWKKYKKTRNEAKSILKRLEFQYRHQESIFLIGKKALFQYTESDWEMIEHYANNALTTKDNKRTPNDWVYLGLSKFKKGDIESSISDLERATNLDSNFEVALKHLGTIYDINKEHQKAIDIFNRIIEINPLNDQAYNNAAISYGILDNHRKSIEYYKKGIEVNPENCFIYTNLFEENIVNNQPLDKKLTKIFEKKFSNNKEAMSTYEMYNIYNKIINNDEIELDKVLNEWHNEYGIIFPVESFFGVELWVSKFEESTIKEKLLKALNFFKRVKEKTTPNNVYK